MAEVRKTLKEQEIHRRAAVAAQEVLQIDQKLDKIAGKKHHLISTKAISGVFARLRTASAMKVNLNLIQSLDDPDINAADGNIENGSCDVLVDDLDCRMAKLSDTIVKIKIPESKLRNNSELEDYIRKNVGTNLKPIRTKSSNEVEDELPQEELVKLAQGPFLVWVSTIGFMLQKKAMDLLFD